MLSDNSSRSVEALHLVDVDPAAAWSRASDVLIDARREGDHVAMAIAERARGLAALHLADLDTAIDHLNRAVRSGRRAGSADLVGEAQMSLAFVLNRRGAPRRAVRVIKAALDNLSGIGRARALAQRAAINQQLGRLDAALTDYRTALPLLRSAEDWMWVQRVLSNRGVLHIFRSQLGAAEADLVEAARVCEQMGASLQTAFVHENLGLVHTRRGDVPAALHHFDEAERRYRALGVQVGSLLVDRSELLLSVRLVAEARQAAERAVEALAQIHRGISLPEALLLLAAAALLDEDPVTALDAAERARRSFARQGRLEWVAMARYAELRCRLALPAGPLVPAARLARAADALAAASWPVQALDARLLAARVALQSGRPLEAEEQLRRASRARRRGPIELRARAWHAEALLRLAAGRRRAAATAIAAGLRVLEEHRVTLGAADLRVRVSAHGTDLAELGLRLALQDGRPRQVLAWAERSRAMNLRLRPVRPPEDEWLADQLAQLRATVAAIRDAETTGRPVGRLIREQTELEQAIRDHCRRRRGSAFDPPVQPPIDQLIAALGDAALVEYVGLDGRLHAVTTVLGRVRIRALGPLEELRGLLDRIPFALRRIAVRSPTAGSRAAWELLHYTGGRLDELLLRPLAREIGDRPLVVVPTEPLQSVPWALLPSCAGRAVTVSPSAALWHRAQSGRRATGRPVAVAGPELPGARAEAERVGGLYPDAMVLVGHTSTTGAVKRALSDSRVAHVAAHGHFRADNPLFSSLQLADGPLTVYDLESLEHAPQLVILAACDSGQSLIYAGDELLGLAATFLTLGTVALVASVVALPDAHTKPLMVALHEHLRAGHSVAKALAMTQCAVKPTDPLAVAAALGFVCWGADHVIAPHVDGSAAVRIAEGSHCLSHRYQGSP
jgi:tetratricopeptide (TPR) repeat protein